MDLNGNHRQIITDCQGTGLTDPEVSPDGTMLSFTCYSPDGEGALFDANIDGSGLRQLTPFAAEVGNKSDWSPDSHWIMFISTPGEGTPPASVNTFTIARDGTDLQAVTNYPAGGTRAFGDSYSPDGKWILLRNRAGRPVRARKDPPRRQRPDRDYAVLHLPAAQYGLGISTRRLIRTG